MNLGDLATNRFLLGPLAVAVLLVSAAAAADEESGARKLLQTKCGACHQRDADEKLDAIESVRKTPEAWRMTLERMQRIHNVQIDNTEVETLVKYLSDELGLAPSEIAKHRYALERRWTVYEVVPDQIPDATVKAVCAACHSYGRAALERRTPEMWRRMPDFKLGLLPFTEMQVRMLGANWYDVAKDAVVPVLTKELPFKSDEWNAWKAEKKPDLSGRWAIVGYDPASGDYFGEMTIEEKGTDEYENRFSYRAENGRTVAGKGSATVYTGYQWRGEGERKDGKAMREIFFASDDGDEIQGRRIEGFFGDVGTDETLYRLNGDSRILGVTPRGLKADGEPHELRIFGMNLPKDVEPDDVDLGDGVKVKKVTRPGDDWLVVEAVAATGAKPGPRSIEIGKLELEGAPVVYEKIDHVKVLPGKGMIYTSGIRMPKLYQQFEAVTFLNGPDGAKATDDDVRIGRVQKAKWRTEEYFRTAEDDDVEFVGEIDQNGLFTPANDAPNPNRDRTESNEGDVWVWASYEEDGTPYEARAYLLVMPARFVFPAIR